MGQFKVIPQPIERMAHLPLALDGQRRILESVALHRLVRVLSRRHRIVHTDVEVGIEVPLLAHVGLMRAPGKIGYRAHLAEVNMSGGLVERGALT